MKRILALAIGIATFFISIAQSRAEPIEYQKIPRQAAVIEYPFSAKTTQAAIEDKMAKMGYKGKDTKGFTVFKGVRITELGADMYDLYFMVDKKSRKDKDNSKITLLISKGLEQFVSDTLDVNVFNNGKTYLNNFGPVIVAYDLEVQIKEQQDAVQKNEKKAANLVDDAAGLQKDKVKLEKKIADNEQEQVKQKAEVETQKQILTTLFSKRKS
jgi:hypothetical protein